MCTLNITYDEKTKKSLIALLLFISCIVSIFILTYLPGQANRKLHSFAQADSLIQNTFDQFHIAGNQVEISVIKVGPNLTRKSYSVRLPPGFSKTQMHAELNRMFYPFSVETPATVSLPEEDMLIQMAYKNTVFRSILLQTDTALVLERNYATVMIAFEGSPSGKLLDEIISFGEPITVVLQVSGAKDAKQLKSNLRSIYSNVSFWLENSAPDNNTGGSASLLLQELEGFQSQGRILSFGELQSLPASSSIIKTALDNNLTFIDVSDAFILDAKLGESIFKQGLAKFEQHAQNGKQPIAIVMADEQALEWLREKFNEFKKRGLYLVPPPEINF